MTKPTTPKPQRQGGRAGQWSDWYTHSRWRTLRANFLRRHPLCVFCEREGRLELATVVDHIEPHKGDRLKFWRGPFQALCKTCHDSTKQSEEKSGRQRWTIGLDGWPVMPGSGGKAPGGEQGS